MITRQDRCRRSLKPVGWGSIFMLTRKMLSVIKSKDVKLSDNKIIQHENRKEMKIAPGKHA
jgi:hypothetical protein